MEHYHHPLADLETRPCIGYLVMLKTATSSRSGHAREISTRLLLFPRLWRTKCGGCPGSSSVVAAPLGVSRRCGVPASRCGLGTPEATAEQVQVGAAVGLAFEQLYIGWSRTSRCHDR